MAMKKKLITLTLAQRVEVIELLDKNETQASIASKFDVGQAVISRIKRNKEKILEEWQKNKNPHRKRKRECSSVAIEEALFQWFLNVRSWQLPVNGPMLKEKALQLAGELGLTNFTASNGWLERWKVRNNIKFKDQQDTRQAIDAPTADKWTVEELPTILKNYRPSNVFIAGETALCWKAMPNKMFDHENSGTLGHKLSDERVTLLLVANMNGLERLQPLVIGKSCSPQCFKNIAYLPVSYGSNNVAWMTSMIWEKWLQKLDCQMRSTNRKILLFCENSRAHTNNVRMTNVKLVFLPSNTTSIIQPMDQGILAAFKAQYRSKFLHHIVAQIDGGFEGTTEELFEKISLLDAVHLIRESWSQLASEIFLHGFKKAGFIPGISDENETDLELKNDVFIPPTMSREEFDNYVSVDDDLPTEDENGLLFFSDFPPEQTVKEEIGNNEDNCVEPSPPPTLLQAIKSMETVRGYLEAHGCKTYENFYKLQNDIFQLSK